MDKLEENIAPPKGLFIPYGWKFIGYNKETGHPVLNLINEEDRKEWEEEMKIQEILGRSLLENG